MTNDGAFRLIATTCTLTAREAILKQAAHGRSALHLAELLTAAVILRETTQPSRRVQMVWCDPSGNAVIADSMPDGKTRGVISAGAEGAPTNILQVNYSLLNGSLHQGVVEIDGQDVSSVVMQYLHSSEQILAMMATAALPGDGEVRQAAGYLVQVLPEASKDQMADLTERLGNLPPIDSLVEHITGPEALVERLFYDWPSTCLADSPVQFGCTCSEHRLIMAMLSLGDAEVDSMMADGEMLAARCDACGTNYQIDPHVVSAMRQQRGRGNSGQGNN